MPKQIASAPNVRRAIFASVTPIESLPAKITTVAHDCGDCNSKFALNALEVTAGEAVSPMCPSCGSQNVTASSEEDGFDFEELKDDECASITCTACDTHLALSVATAQAVEGKLNCVVCGTALTFAFDESDMGEDEEMEEDEDMEDLDLSEDEEASSDEDEDEEMEEEEEEEATASSDEDEEMEEEEEAKTSALAGDEDEEMEDEEVPEVEEEEASSDEPAEDMEDLDLLDAVEASFDPKNPPMVRFFRQNDNILASVDHITVGYLNTKEVAASRREIVAKPEYLRALSNSASTHGLAKTLADFDFNKTSVKVNAAALKDLADQRVQAAAVEIASTQTVNMKKEIAACLGIASMGINKGFYPGENGVNNLKRALASELATAGVRNPNRLVDRVFASHGDGYNKAILTQAMSLMEQAPEVRNQMAIAIKDMAYASGLAAKAKLNDVEEEVSEDDEFEGTEVDDVVEARLNVPVRAHAEHSEHVRRGERSPVEATVAGFVNKHGTLFPKA